MITLPYSNATTSKAAARSPHVLNKSTADRRLIAEFIARQAAHGATDQELAEGCQTIHPDALRARRGNVADRGFITTEPGERRSTKSGHMADVWFITAAGMKACGMEGWSAR